MCAIQKAETPGLATGCSLFIHLLQQTLVILLTGRLLGVEHVGRAILPQGTTVVPFSLQRCAKKTTSGAVVGI
jgi:hypothetical protein